MIGWEGTPDDLSKVLEKVEGNGASTAVAGQTIEERTVGGTPQNFFWSGDKLRELWARLSKGERRKRQVRVLEILAQQGGKVTREELLRRSKIEPDELKAVLSAITRNAKRISGYKKARIIEQGADGGSYYLPETILNFVRSQVNA
jgi:hypothetical protein